MRSTLAQVRRAAKALIRRMITHRRGFYWNSVTRRFEPRTLQPILEQLGVSQGSVIVVHSSLSAFGYIVGGESAVLDVLCEAVGPQGTIVMPSLPFRGSMEAFVASGPLFQVDHTPSASGKLTEVFRQIPGVQRSLHPTHSVSAWGALARDLVEGHSRSPRPCGKDTPWGRLATAGAQVLRIGTGALTLAHHAQEAVDFPNLFLEKPVALTCVDSRGHEHVVETFVYRSVIPQLIYLERDHGDQRMSVSFRDYPLLYSGKRQALYEADPSRRLALERLLGLRKQFAAEGHWKTAVVSGCILETVPVRPWLDYYVRTQSRLISQLRELYDLARLEHLAQSGGYPP